jgi:hypothetical protein
MMFQIPLKLEIARWWFGPVALLLIRQRPLTGSKGDEANQEAGAL